MSKLTKNSTGKRRYQQKFLVGDQLSPETVSALYKSVGMTPPKERWKVQAS